MIKKMKSKLSIKVFLITVILMAACCVVTYCCIARFAPYIYSYKLSEAEETAEMLSQELSYSRLDEAQYIISFYNDILTEEFDDEFIFHIFQNSGEEVALPYLDSFTDRQIEDYESVETTGKYQVTFLEEREEYILLIAKNTNKESQVAAALQKSVPILSIVIFIVSVIAALFYAWYMTTPVKKVSRISKQMADMDFSGFCPMGRTDEIGVLSDSLTILSRKLTATLSQLQQANQKLQMDIDMERQLERQRVEFFSAASHELKTPITIIKGQLQGMLYQVGRYKDRDTYLAQSLEVTGTLEKMVQEILTISLLETPDYVCNKCNINLEKLINDRLAAYEDLFMQKSLVVKKSIHMGTYILGDMRLIQKVLDNLLGNAAAYSPMGNHVFVKLWKEAAKVKLAIENTGVYIPNEDIPKLFEAFYRVDQSRSRQTGGTGLGLYIVKSILDLHEAAITVRNTRQGVIFSIQFNDYQEAGLGLPPISIST